MRQVASIRLQAYYTYRALFSWLNWPAYISNVLLRPIMQVALFYLIGQFIAGGHLTRFYLVGMVAYNSPLIVTAGVAQSLVTERNLGTLPFLFVSPVTRWHNYFARGVLHVPNGLLGAAIGLAALLALRPQLGPVIWWGVAAGIVLLTLSTMAYALLFSTLGIVWRDWTTFYGASLGFMLLLTGAVIPLAAIPVPFRLLADILPVTHGLEAMRAAFVGGSITEILHELALELVVAVGWATAGFWLFRTLEELSRRIGSFEMLDV